MKNKLDNTATALAIVPYLLLVPLFLLLDSNLEVFYHLLALVLIVLTIVTEIILIYRIAKKHTLSKWWSELGENKYGVVFALLMFLVNVILVVKLPHNFALVSWIEALVYSPILIGSMALGWAGIGGSPIYVLSALFHGVIYYMVGYGIGKIVYSRRNINKPKTKKNNKVV
jgi:hypothetical protein